MINSGKFVAHQLETASTSQHGGAEAKQLSHHWGKYAVYRWDLQNFNFTNGSRINIEDYCLVGVPELLSTMSGSVYDYIKKMGDSNHGNVKWYIALQVVLEKGVKNTDGEQVISGNPTFYSGYRELLDASNNQCKFINQYEDAVDIINNRFQEWQSKGSGWRLIGFKWLDLGVSQYDPIYAGCYMELPQTVKGRVINVKINNSKNENKCFQLAILAHLYDPPSSRKYRDTWLLNQKHELNFEGIEYPVSMDDIDRFENQNPDFAIFVLAYDITGTYDYKRGDKIVTKDRFRGRTVYIHRTSENRTAKHIIHLLLLNKLDTQEHHFTLINTKNGVNGLSRLLRGVRNDSHEVLYCPYCLQRFYSRLYSHNMEINLNDHIELCREHKVQRVEMPKKIRVIKGGEWVCGNKLEFTNYTPTLKVPFVIYLTIHGKKVPVGYSFIIIDESGNPYKRETYHAQPDDDHEDVCKKLLLRLWEIKGELEPMILENKSITFTDAQLKNRFNDDSICALCGLVMLNHEDAPGGLTVDHHSHTTGKFIGRVHNNCNLQCKRPVVIPVIAHNLSKFGMHHLVRCLYVFKDRASTTCMATNTEQVNSIEIKEKSTKDQTRRSPVFLRFLDSTKFLQEDSLDNIVAELRDQYDGQNQRRKFLNFQDTFPITTSQFKIVKKKKDTQQLEKIWHILLRKTAQFSYETWWCDIDNKNLSDVRPYDYNLFYNMDNVRQLLRIGNLGAYLDFSMLLEVALLADVFQRYRKMIYSKLKLDPCHFYSSSHTTYQAALKYTPVTSKPKSTLTFGSKVDLKQIYKLSARFGFDSETKKFSLDLITDPTMYLFFEKALRGGPAIVPHRYACANDPLIQGGYDPSKPIKTIKHFDVKSLYGSCMREPLPVGCFEWIHDTSLEKYEALMSGEDRDVHFPDNSYYGCVLEVDLEYPPELHDSHKDFPLAPVKETVNQYVEPSRIAKGSCGTRYIHAEKLLLTLNDKNNYILHYRLLKQYLKLGLKLKKIHRGVEFYQEPWLRPYIDHLWDAQHSSTTRYEKKIWKHMTVSLSGKTIENTRNYVDMKLVYDKDTFMRSNSSPRVERVLVFNGSPDGGDKNVVLGLLMTPRVVQLKKPIYLGMTVMDLGKLSMYKLHYEHFMPTYGLTNAQLLYHDTDSLTYCLTVDQNQRSELQNIKSILSKKFPHVFASCKWDIGRLKDETDGEPIQEHIGLSPKMYSYVSGYQAASKYLNGKQIAKGVNQRECPLDHQMYRECLFHDKEFGASINTWRSMLHKNTLIEQFRRTLSPIDDTRVVLQDKISTLPYGHYSLSKNTDPEKKREPQSDVDSNPYKLAKLD